MLSKNSYGLSFPVLLISFCIFIPFNVNSIECDYKSRDGDLLHRNKIRILTGVNSWGQIEFPKDKDKLKGTVSLVGQTGKTSETPYVYFKFNDSLAVIDRNYLEAEDKNCELENIAGNYISIKDYHQTADDPRKLREAIYSSMYIKNFDEIDIPKDSIEYMAGKFWKKIDNGYLLIGHGLVREGNDEYRNIMTNKEKMPLIGKYIAPERLQTLTIKNDAGIQKGISSEDYIERGEQLDITHDLLAKDKDNNWQVILKKFQPNIRFIPLIKLAKEGTQEYLNTIAIVRQNQILEKEKIEKETVLLKQKEEIETQRIKKEIKLKNDKRIRIKIPNKIKILMSRQFQDASANLDARIYNTLRIAGLDQSQILNPQPEEMEEILTKINDSFFRFSGEGPLGIASARNLYQQLFYGDAYEWANSFLVTYAK